MNEKKNIDRLFQERFKDFEMDPPESSWENISERLGKKRKRRILPFWWQRAGVAAALILGFLLIDQKGGLNTFSKNANVNVTDGSAPKPGNPGITPGQIETESSRNQSIITGKPVNGVAEGSDIPNAAEGSRLNQRTRSDKSVNKIGPLRTNEVTTVAASDTESANEPDSADGITTGKKAGKRKGAHNKKWNTGVAQQNSRSNRNSGSGMAPSGKTGVASHQIQSEKENKKNQSAINSVTNTQIASTSGIKNQSDSGFNKTNDKKVTDNNTPTQMLAGTQNPAEKIKVDSAAIATAELLAMGELLNEKEEKSVTQGEQKINRWLVDTHVAPIYLSSLNGGSPTDPSFANNSKAYKTTLSYGIGARYSVGKKLSVRTGVNSLAMEYSTTGVTFNQSADSRRQLLHVSSNIQGSLVNIESGSPNSASLTTLESFNINASQSKAIPGSISQKTGYIEVPVELTYSLLDKRFGVEVIGGMSTLFLQQNEISLVSGQTEMSIGKADNLNATHFSTNLGLGVYYRIFRNMNFRMEPMVKYQLNAYSDSGNYKPYFFGVYTGLNYRF